MDWQIFEIIALDIKERETALLREKAEACSDAVGGNAVGDLADLWGCSKQLINTWAQVYHYIGPDNIYPDAPLSLYRAALDTDDPLAWLLKALDEGWSSRQLKDAADVSKGKHVSRVKWLPDVECEIARVASGDGYLVKPIDYEPSGETPQRVRVTAVEVLQSDTVKVTE